MKRVLSVALAAAFLTFAAFGQEQEAPKKRTTGSGLQFIDHVEGPGEEARRGDTVAVHYTGWLYSGGKRGALFDTSRRQGREPFEFTIGDNRVIAGWEEGVQGMKVGGKRELFIPPNLGYGRNGAPPVIPPNATLNFEIELIRIVD